jgi:hypothetical protein
VRRYVPASPDIAKFEDALRNAAILLPALFVLSPRIHLMGPAFRLGDLWLYGMFPFYVMYLVMSRRFRIRWVDYLFGALFVSTAVSIAYGGFALDVPVGLRDLFELPKLLKYYLGFRIVADLPWRSSDARRVGKVFLVTTVVALVFAFFQYYNVLWVNHFVTPGYVSPWHVVKIQYLGRVAAPLENPNYLAFFLAIPVFGAFLALTDMFRRDGDHRALLYSAGLLAATGVVVNMAVARTAFVATSVGLLAVAAVRYLGFAPERRRRVLRAVSLALVVVLLAGVFGYVFLEAVPHGIRSMSFVTRMGIGLSEVISAEEEERPSNWQQRLERWGVAWETIEDYPVLGVGPAKAVAEEEVRPPTDNEYLVYAVRYGGVGLVLYITFYVLMLGYAWRRALADEAPQDSTLAELGALAVGLTVTAGLFNIMAGTFYNLQIFSVMLFVYGFLFGLAEAGEGREDPGEGAEVAAVGAIMRGGLASGGREAA